MDGNEDADKDKLTNLQEYRAKMNPLKADTDNDGISDANEDTDRDSLNTCEEFAETLVSRLALTPDMTADELVIQVKEALGVATYKELEIEVEFFSGKELEAKQEFEDKEEDEEDDNE